MLSKVLSRLRESSDIDRARPRAGAGVRLELTGAWPATAYCLWETENASSLVIVHMDQEERPKARTMVLTLLWVMDPFEMLMNDGLPFSE